MIYLDSAATTLQKPPAVAKAVAWAVNNLSSPGRGGHKAAMAAADEMFSCREMAAEFFNVKDPDHVVITHSATHGLNIAIKSLVQPGSRVLISGYEHNAVIRPLHAMGANIVVTSSALFDPEMAIHAFESRLSGKLSAVICNHVSNVFGYVLPIERIAQMCQARGIPLIVDLSQSAGMMDIDFTKLGAVFAAMPGHKGLYGSQGTGILLCSKVPDGIIQGGTGGNSKSRGMPDFLPDRLEPGTHNMPGIAGLNEGLKFIRKKGAERILAHERVLIDQAADGLAGIEGITVFKSESGDCQTGVLSFVVENMSCETVAEVLARRNIAVRSGMHCAPSAHLSAGTNATGTVRISVSAFNTRREISLFLGAVEDIAGRRGY
ncbi:MAG: aminotransferase class V-fold PLP-dependent enzyme [Oscillospiraceae bacterium]|nr:aminotransferase class V-fold PLP-dependent enzyme [Oscillospiraceae bacterium]